MGKQKQQVISRFFAPKSEPSCSTAPLQNPPTPSPKITATVSFSTAKRLRSTPLLSPPKKMAKITHSPSLSLSNPTLHQKFVEKLLEPSSECVEPSRACALALKYTPLEQQVVGLKDKYPDVLLMVEVGYRYRFFGEDAENAARVLGIYAYMDHNFLTASVPTFRLHFHVRRLVIAGYKVGLVKQTETAAVKAHGANKLGPFSRGLSALYTKATLEAATDLGDGEEKCGSCSNYLFCVVEKIIGNLDVKIGAVGVEVSTGEIVYGEFDDNLTRSGLEAMILNLSPAELLLGKPLSKQTEKLLLAYAGSASDVRVENASQDLIHTSVAIAEIMSLYETLNGNNSPSGQQEGDMLPEPQGSGCLAIEEIIAMPDLAIQALLLTIRHLKQFGFERIFFLGSSFRSFSNSIEMTLSSNTLQQLEVLRNNSDGSECGSLLQCMDCTVTLFGSRLFRHWVTHPLCDRTMVHERLDAVSEILKSMDSYKASQSDESCRISVISQFHHILWSALKTLKKAPDIQRGITRIFHRTATASELISVIQAILVAGKQLKQLHVQLKGDNSNLQVGTIDSVLLRKLILTASSPSIISDAERLLSGLNKEAADQKDFLNLFVIADGKFPKVTAARSKVFLANDKMDQLIDLFRKKLKIGNLEFTSVSGVSHLIEVPLDTVVPSNWVKVNSTKKFIRYHPPEVLNALDQLTLAKEELSIICHTSWDDFLQTFSGCYPEFRAAVQSLAALDCLYSLATFSWTKNYVRPVFVNDSEPMQIQLISGRHPVMENILQGNFVPNDTNLHDQGEYCQIVTGPNMGGKSVYIRQVALIALMAHVGSFVPASSAKLHVLDGIYTRMGASDNINLGRSSFLEEVSEASHILQHCTSRSLVIIDELGRGTSAHDGVAIAYATLHYLLEHKRSMVLFVTHYPEITEKIGLEFPGSVGAYHVSYMTPEKETHQQMDSEVTYLYKLVPGVGERSFGFKVAQLAQLPYSCIERAISMASRFQVQVRKRQENIEVENAFRNLLVSMNIAFVQEDDPKRLLSFLKNARNVATNLLSMCN